MIKVSKATVANTDLDSSQAFIFFRSGVHLILMISALGDDIFARIRQVANELEESLFDSETEEALPDRLTKGLSLIQEKLTGVEDLEILLGGFQDENILYLISQGDHRVYLDREGKLIRLISSSQNSQLISGHILANDRLLLITHEFDETEVDKLINDPTDELEEGLSTFVMDNPKPVAAIRVDFLEESSDKIPKFENLPADLSTINMNRLKEQLLGKIVALKNRLVISSYSRYFRLAVLLLVALLVGFFILKIVHRRENTQIVSNQTVVKENPELTYKISHIDSWPLFLDLSLIKPGFSSERMSYSLGQITLLDPNLQTLDLLSLDKKNQILAGKEQMGQASASSLNGDFAYSYSKDKGLVKIDTKSLKTTQIAKPDPDWGDISDLQGFSSNIYLLDNIKNQIWKYTPTSAGYSDKIPYLKSGVKADFSGGKKILIDSSVWILSSGVLNKYTAGVEDSFDIGGLDKPIKDLTNFFVSDETDNIYLVDGLNSRLIVLDKSGKYISQIISDKFKTLSDLIVDEKGSKIYILEGGKIYVTDLPK